MTVADLITQLQQCDPQVSVFYVDREWPGFVQVLRVEKVESGAVSNKKNPDGDWVWKWGEDRNQWESGVLLGEGWE